MVKRAPFPFPAYRTSKFAFLQTNPKRRFTEFRGLSVWLQLGDPELGPLCELFLVVVKVSKCGCSLYPTTWGVTLIMVK